MPYKIISFDNILIFNYGLKYILDKFKDYELIEFFTDFENLTTFLKNSKNSPDILLISDNIPKKNFEDAVRFINETNEKLKIIAISENTDEFHIFNVIKGGAAAYLYKPNITGEILKEALDAVINNEDYFNEPISNIIIQSYVKKAKKGDEISQRNPKNLTRREVQVLQLICEGLTNKQIADGLFISVRTVDAHKNHIMQKLGLKSTAELVKFAIKNGYVKL